MPSIDDIVDKNEFLILRTIDRLDRRISRLIARLDIEDNGRLISDTVNLDRAIKMRLEVSKSFGEFNESAKVVTDYSPILKETSSILKKAGIKKGLTKADNDLIKAFSDDAYNELSSLGSQYASRINERIYTGVVAGDSLEDMTLDIKQLLKGGKDRAGKPLSAHAETIATTRYMEVDSSLLKKKSEEFDINRFKYTGSLIKDSRQWCKDHKDQILTKEEIDKWRDREWQGKKEGDPFIVRGGWRCRHRWIPIIN